MHRPLAALALVLALSTWPALAEPASQAGADRIAKAFQTYLGPAAQMVAVVPQGDTYALTLDAAPLIAMGQAQGLTGSISPLHVTLTDKGDGTWGVAIDQPLAMEAHVPGAFDVKEDVASASLTGTFDAALMSFTKLDGTFSGIKVDETIAPKDQPQTHAQVSMDKVVLTSTGTANPQGGANLSMQMDLTGLAEEIASPMNGGAPVQVLIKAQSVSETATVTGLRMDRLLPLLAWGVAHDTALKAMAYRAELKPLATAALPIFSNTAAHAAAHLVSIDTPLGAIGLKELAADIDVNGLVADGKFREAISVSGLTLPDGLVPAWAAPLVPQTAGLDVQVTGYDANAAATLALGVLDLPDGQDPAPDFQDKILAALLPTGAVTVTLNPGALQGDGYKLTYEGSLNAGPATDIPTGTATVTLTGYDALQAALKQAPDDMKMQAMMGMGAMRGLAKVGSDGALTWVIDGTTPGQVLVNGMDVSKMGGGN